MNAPEHKETTTAQNAKAPSLWIEQSQGSQEKDQGRKSVEGLVIA